MLGKVASFMEEYHMAEAGDRILAAVSGGADSLCLLMITARGRASPAKFTIARQHPMPRSIK